MVRTRAGSDCRKSAANFFLIVAFMVFVPTLTLAADGPLQPFLGGWDLTIKSPGKERPSWIEVSEEQGKPKVVMVGVTDHATPLAKVDFKDSELEFVSPKGEEGFQEDMTFRGKSVDGQLTGTAVGSNGSSWPWVARKAPSFKRAGTPAWAVKHIESSRQKAERVRKTHCTQCGI